MNHDRSHFMKLTALGLAALIALGGCSSFEIDKFDMKKNIPWGAGKDGETKAPMKVVAVWTDTVLSEGMKAATRGFGGRLMFYDAEGGKPIKVKGSLLVYAFDETGRDVEQAKPDRKYVFTSEQFEKHYSKSSLGHSYSVWLPWDAAGGPLREISLLVRFQPEKGSVVIGDPSKHHLPGPNEKDPTKYPEPKLLTPPPSVSTPRDAQTKVTSTSTNLTAKTDGVQLVGFETQTLDEAKSAAASGGVSNGAPRRMSTTTISLPTSTDALRRTGFAQPTQPGFGTPATGGGITASTVAGPWVGSGVGAPAGWPAAAPAAVQSSANSPAAALSPSALSPSALSSSAQSPTAPPGAHYEPGRRRPLGAPLERLERGHAPWQHSHATPQSGPQGSR